MMLQSLKKHQIIQDNLYTFIANLTNNMKTKIFIPIVLATNLLLGQSFQEKSILTIDDSNSYNVEEFLHVYNKNRDLAEKVDPKNINEYMDLFVNFKLKVLDAKEHGLHTNESFISEYDGYKYQVSKNYLTDSYAEEEIQKEAYNRLKEQVRASHILITVPETAPKEESDKAYQKTLDVLEQLKTNSFESVAIKESQDPSVSKNKGDLGFFTALQMVYPFENAAYNTPVGNYSKPLRTQFGYHILKVTDRRKNPGERQVSHIMLKTNKGKDNVAQKKKIDEIYKKLEAGENFEELVSTYSEDTRTATKGGLINWFGTGKMAKPFEKAAFELKEINKYSKPIETKYGWHIVKLLGKRDVRSFEEEKSFIKNKISKNDRADIANTAFMNNLKDEYNFKIHEKNVKSMGWIMNHIDFKSKPYTYFEEYSTYKKPIYTFTNTTFTQSDLLRLIKTNEGGFAKSTDQISFINNLITQHGNDALLAYEKTQLTTKYPEYRLLLQEYYDGILLYEISKNMIWDKAVKDTTGLTTFYEANKSNYMYDTRVNATIFEVANEKLASKTKKYLKKGKSIDFIREKLNATSTLNFNTHSGVYNKGDNPLIDAVEWKEGYSKNLKKGQGVAFIAIEEVIPPQAKALNEARGLVISDYQNHLENKWLSNLKAKHNVKVDPILLEQVKQKSNQ